MEESWNTSFKYSTNDLHTTAMGGLQELNNLKSQMTQLAMHCTSAVHNLNVQTSYMEELLTKLIAIQSTTQGHGAGDLVSDGSPNRNLNHRDYAATPRFDGSNYNKNLASLESQSDVEVIQSGYHPKNKAILQENEDHVIKEDQFEEINKLPMSEVQRLNQMHGSVSRNEKVYNGVQMLVLVDEEFENSPIEDLLRNPESQLSAFIFNESYDLSEIICDMGNAHATRYDFMSLQPHEKISSEIINVVVDALSGDEKTGKSGKKNWYLPTHFTFKVFHDLHRPLNVFLRSYKKDDKYISDLRICEKIFVPINESGGHWYLCVIDIKEGITMILDSLRSMDSTREAQVKRLMAFFDELFALKEFQITQSRSWKRISSFKVIYMNVFQQRNMNDCGLYVIHYMQNMLHNLSATIYEELDSNRARNELVKYLIFHPRNIEKEKIIWSSFKHSKKDDRIRDMDLG